LKHFILLLFISLFFSFCKNREAPAVALMEVDQFSSAYLSNADTFGNQKLNDVWILTNKEDLGVYELPARVPIKVTGDSVEFFMSPGFKYLDISDVRVKYLPFKPYSKKIKFEAGQIYKIIPKLKYFDIYKVDIENFEGSGVKFDKLASSDTTLTIGNELSQMFNNTKYGQIVLTNTKTQAGIKTSNKYNLPLANTTEKAFLEFNYKSDVIITVGLFDGNQKYVPYVEEEVSKEWKKAYVDIGDASKTAGIAGGSYIYIVVKNTDNLATANIYLDEIKVIYRK
jgi:hypothetical protein